MGAAGQQENVALLLLLLLGLPKSSGLLWGRGFCFHTRKTCCIWRSVAFSRPEGEGFPLPQRKPPPKAAKIEFEAIRLGPAVRKAPSVVLWGGIWGPCASLSEDTPSESHTRAGPRCPRKGSTARGFGLAEPPQVGPLTSIPPPPHFSVDDLIELCLFVPGTTEHVLEAINYRNVAISKRTPGTG